jgi:hypothetical protein
MKILDIPQSDACGTFVSVRTRYGQIRRRLGVIRKGPGPAQISHRAKFGHIRALWRTVSEAQRATWASDTHDVRSRTRMGQDGGLPPYLVFVKVNATRVAQGLAPVLTRPKHHTFDANPVGELVATNTGGVVELKLSVPTTPATDIMVLGAAPCSARWLH